MLEVDAAISEDVDVVSDACEKVSVSEVLSAQDRGEHDTGVETDDDPSVSG